MSISRPVSIHILSNKSSVSDKSVSFYLIIRDSDRTDFIYFFSYISIDDFFNRFIKIEQTSKFQSTFFHVTQLYNQYFGSTHGQNPQPVFTTGNTPSFPASINKLGLLSSSYYRFDLMVRARSMPMAEQIIKRPEITGVRPQSKRSAKWSLQMRIISATKGSILLRRWWDFASFQPYDGRNMFFHMCGLFMENPLSLCKL